MVTEYGAFTVIVFLGSASQWTRSSGQATPSPNFEGGLQSMVSQHVYFYSFSCQRCNKRMLKWITEVNTQCYGHSYILVPSHRPLFFIFCRRVRWRTIWTKPSMFFSVTPADKEDQAWLKCTICSLLA